MKTSKSLKISKKEYTEQLVPAIAGYRETLQKKCGFSSDNYVRIFTEQRARGARSKYYFIMKDFPVNKVLKFVEKNSEMVVNGKTYRLDMEVGRDWGLYGTSSNHNYGDSYSLYCTRVK